MTDTEINPLEQITALNKENELAEALIGNLRVLVLSGNRFIQTVDDQETIHKIIGRLCSSIWINEATINYYEDELHDRHNHDNKRGKAGIEAGTGTSK